MRENGRTATRDLYPAIEPFETGRLEVGHGHVLYYEQSGNPNGRPVVFLHGGPGAGSVPVHRRFFDPGRYRIVIFDQRGAGRSSPAASTEHNITQDLVADLERLRAHLEVERWLLFGGSWGSTLALAYGIAYPKRCLGFVLRGVFLGRSQEVDWFLNGMGRIWPEAHRDFVEFLPEAERTDVLAGYRKRLMDPDPAVHLPAARAWSDYETACSCLVPKPQGPTGRDGTMSPGSALALARIEAHYFAHGMFLGDDELLKGVGALRNVPCAVVHGRYDMVCPVVSAYELVEHWPAAELQIIADAGHSALERGIRSALVAACDAFAQG